MKYNILACALMAGVAFKGNAINAHSQEKRNSDAPRPNILFIPVDDLRPELGCYGDATIKTPNIDRMAKEGVVFTRAYCQQAVCNPSRASLLTGMRPDAIKVWDLWTNFREHCPEVKTLPQYFKENGYLTVGLGKTFHNNIPDTISWSEKPHIEGYPFDPDAVYATEENRKLVEKRKQDLIKQGKNRVDQLGHWYIKTVATEIADVPDDAYFDGAQTTLAIEKLKELKKKKEPFFLSVGYYRPHLPFNAPKKYWDMYKREEIPLAENQFVPESSPGYALHGDYELRGYADFRDLPHPEEKSLPAERQRLLKHGYFASVSYVDAQIGRLLSALEELNLAENTIVVLWGDHGWKLGEHNSWCKQTNYEIDTRVPMIFAGKGVTAKDAQCHALTEFVDIYPSLCELAGLEVPEHLQGSSLVPLLKNPQLKWKSAVYSQFLMGRSGSKKDRAKQRMGYTIRTDRYRYVEWYDWKEDHVDRKEVVGRELYDHAVDPQENQNIANHKEKAHLVKELSERLRKEGIITFDRKDCKKGIHAKN